MIPQSKLVSCRDNPPAEQTSFAKKIQFLPSLRRILWKMEINLDYGFATITIVMYSWRLAQYIFFEPFLSSIFNKELSFVIFHCDENKPMIFYHSSPHLRDRCVINSPFHCHDHKFHRKSSRQMSIIYLWIPMNAIMTIWWLFNLDHRTNHRFRFSSNWFYEFFHFLLFSFVALLLRCFAVFAWLADHPLHGQSNRAPSTIIDFDWLEINVMCNVRGPNGHFVFSIWITNL